MIVHYVDTPSVPLHLLLNSRFFRKVLVSDLNFFVNNWINIFKHYENKITKF